jgi:hypothetical protein
LKQYCQKKGLEFLPISAVTGKGIEELKYAIGAKVTEARTVMAESQPTAP